MTGATRRLTLSALFIALGVLLPIFFHGVGLGAVFVPMFWPVAASAFFLPVFYICCVGILAPILSMLLTGMPPVPMLYIMIAELGVLGIVTSYFYLKTRWGLFWPLCIAVFASQIAHFIAIIPLAGLLGLPSWLTAFPMILKGLPGLVLLLVIMPMLLSKVKRQPVFGKR
jgi:hypothetical protein